jgi:DNA-entry nuclease
MTKTNTIKASIFSVLIACCLIFTGCGGDAKTANPNSSQAVQESAQNYKFAYSDVPQYDGKPYVVLNNNIPTFDKEDGYKVFEDYSELDSLGRCGVAFANVGKELMPTEERGKIGMIKPSGWHTARYDDIIKDKYLYNRCHLIAFMLAGENANNKNLITGTRYLNIEGMLPFEDKVKKYIDKTGNHVLYRVTPVFVGNELVARGVQMEAQSVEDKGEGIKYNVFCYNVQPGIEIDYATGESKKAK